MSIPLESLAAPTIICCITERKRERERERKKEREGEEKKYNYMITCIIYAVSVALLLIEINHEASAYLDLLFTENSLSI